MLCVYGTLAVGAESQGAESAQFSRSLSADPSPRQEVPRQRVARSADASAPLRAHWRGSLNAGRSGIVCKNPIAGPQLLGTGPLQQVRETCTTSNIT